MKLTTRVFAIALCCLLVHANRSVADFVLSIEEGTNDVDTGTFTVKLKASPDSPELVDFPMIAFTVDLTFSSLPSEHDAGFPINLSVELPPANPAWSFFGPVSGSMSVADGETLIWSATPNFLAGAGDFNPIIVPAEGLDILSFTYDPVNSMEGTRGIAVAISGRPGFSPEFVGRNDLTNSLTPTFQSAQVVLPSTAIPEPSSFMLIGLMASMTGGVCIFRYLSGWQTAD